jgi:alpha-beta hydrolase superfamily lysophospholipase
MTFRTPIIQNILSARLFALAALFSCTISNASGLFGRPHNSNEPVNFAQKRTLQKGKRVRSALVERGFQPYTFNSDDGEELRGMVYEQPKAKATIVICPGLLIKKEMYAALVDMYGAEYNLFLFDARGQGKSKSWSIALHARSYGKQEYKDITAAISHAEQLFNKPIYVLGFCSGAYHAARALIHYQNQGFLETSGVKGLIFDSGWYSVRRASKTAPYAAMKEWLFGQFKSRNSKSRHIAAYMFYTILYPLFMASKTILLDSAYAWNDRKLNIFNALQNLDVPILFIHSMDDDRIPVNDIYELSETITPERRGTWWIEEGRSKHAWHFLYLPDEYHYATTEFMNRIF